MPAVSPMRVLVVDDNDGAAMTMALLLKRSGHEAVVANSGGDALEQAPLFHPDVMFIDLAMPVVDGLSVARQLRQTAEFAETPLIAVSGYVDAEYRAQATAAGFTDFLPKPYPLTALQATMERVSAKASASREKAVVSRLIAAQSRRLNEELRQGLDDYWRTRRSVTTPVTVEKSGISNIITLPERPAADELRSWLKYQRCRVGPVFQPSTGAFAFFVYSRRHCMTELIGKHGRFRIEKDKR